MDTALLGAGRDALVATTTKVTTTPAVNMENKFREEGRFMYLPALSVPAPCMAYPQLLLAQSTTEDLVAAVLAGPDHAPDATPLMCCMLVGQLLLLSPLTSAGHRPLGVDTVS